jgi:cytochrome c1
MIMASIYDLDNVGFVGGQFKEPEEDTAFFTAYFKKLKLKCFEQKKENQNAFRLHGAGKQKMVVQ